jgi:N-acetylglutamate synthase-like GNAT family acetyltransferase
MNIKQIGNIRDISGLLQVCLLPVSDLKINENCVFFGGYEGTRLDSCVGLEMFGNVTLLRSLAVSPSSQRKGKGGVLIAYAEDFCKSKGIQFAYLLTSTAISYFSSFGYIIISRDVVPDVIKSCTQYSSVCPGSATIMLKDLAQD